MKLEVREPYSFRSAKGIELLVLCLPTSPSGIQLALA